MKRFIGISILGVLFLIAVFACSLGLMLEQRIQQFASDLNLPDRADIYENFHSAQTLDYPTIRDTDFFGIDFPVVNPLVPTDLYVITVVDASDPMQVIATIDNEDRWAAGPYDVLFSMAYEGLGYKIVTMQIDYKLGDGMEYIVQ